MDSYLDKLLGEREEIILVTHQHWFILLRNITFELLLIVATVVIVTLIMNFWMPGPTTATGYMLLLIPLYSMTKDMLRWHNHKYVVTSYRVIQIFGVFNKNVTDSSLEKVNDVKMQQSFFGRLFNFGDIEIMTASELGINRFTYIGDPVLFKTSMLNAKHILDGIEGKPPTEQMVMDVPRLIKELDELCQQGLLTPQEFTEKRARLLARI